MKEIVIQKSQANEKKPKRSAVVVSPNTYIRVFELAHEIGIPIEKLVDKLLTEALDAVKVVE